MQCQCRSGRGLFKSALRIQAYSPLNTTALPFLYQTRTFQKPLPRHHTRPASTRYHDSIPFTHHGSAASSPNSTINVNSLDERPSPRDRASAGPDGPAPRQHTITRGERKAFKMLFDSLTKRRPGERSKKDNDGPWLTEMELADIDPDAGSLDALTATDLADGHADASRYPMGLRGMASAARLQVAREMMKQRRDAREKHEEQGDFSAEHVAQKRTFRALKKAIRSARTDTDIWTILQTELFSRLTKLEEWRLEQEEGAPAAETGMKKTSLKRAKKIKSKQFDKSEEQSHHPPLASLSMAAYSSLFFFAARELSRRTFYTPLAPAVLAAVRAHSLTASLVGTSVALYNETISHRWRTGRDVSNIIALLRDMTSMGMPMSQITYDLLDEAVHWGDRAQTGEFGFALAAVEKMVGRQSEWRQLHEWRDRAREGLEQRALAETRRAEAYAQIKAEGALAEDEAADEASDPALEDEQAAAVAGV